jgi:imidazolonepropionase-like amidohydrolase
MSDGTLDRGRPANPGGPASDGLVTGTDDRLLLVADRLVDGTGRGASGRSFVAVEGGRVAAVGPADEAPSRVPAAVPRLDFPGCTILPGLMDSHVHLTFSAGPVPFEELQADPDARLLLRGAANARAALQAGVTTVRDLGARDRIALLLRDAIADGLVPGPRVLACGRPITSPGGHCHFLGGVAQGVEAVSRLTAELVAEGADAIKVMATGGNMTRSSDPLRAQFSVEELRAIVRIAGAAGRRVTVHARGVDGMRRAVEAGVDGIEHARMEVAPGEWGFDDALARAMAERGITAAPTLAASFRASQAKAAGVRVGLREGMVPIPVRQRNAWRLREAGVRVVVGTDAGAALARFDEAVHVEMELLVGAGWSPLEAIRAGTLDAAFAVGLEKEIGSVEPGKAADLLVVRGDPTRNVSDLRQVAQVVKGGRPVASGGSLTDDRRPFPWPLGEIAERRSLWGPLR